MKNIKISVVIQYFWQKLIFSNLVYQEVAGPAASQ